MYKHLSQDTKLWDINWSTLQGFKSETDKAWLEHRSLFRAASLTLEMKWSKKRGKCKHYSNWWTDSTAVLLSQTMINNPDKLPYLVLPHDSSDVCKNEWKSGNFTFWSALTLQKEQSFLIQLFKFLTYKCWHTLQMIERSFIWMKNEKKKPNRKILGCWFWSFFSLKNVFLPWLTFRFS